MSNELKINKELASLAVTLGEWYRIQATVNAKIKSGEFNRVFNLMADELLGSYSIVVESLRPFLVITNEKVFSEEYLPLEERYRNTFLQAASIPRKHADEAYEYFLQLSLLPEFKTSYPILKRTMESLDVFVDKWVTNDAWIVMSADVVFKTLNRLLLEISKFKSQDEEEAWQIFNLAFTSFTGPLLLIEQRIQRFSCRQDF